MKGGKAMKLNWTMHSQSVKSLNEKHSPVEPIPRARRALCFLNRWKFLVSFLKRCSFYRKKEFNHRNLCAGKESCCRFLKYFLYEKLHFNISIYLSLNEHAYLAFVERNFWNNSFNSQPWLPRNSRSTEKKSNRIAKVGRRTELIPFHHIKLSFRERSSENCLISFLLNSWDGIFSSHWFRHSLMRAFIN